MPDQKKKSVLRSFSRNYWMVIMFEFFERGSYYGMMSVLSVYLTDILGFAKTSVGLIKGTIQPILYFLPILSGAIADRFGYRRTLTIAFALLGGGYFLTSQMSSYTAVFLALCVMALGAGTFKPIITGSIARTTDESNSTLGFGIYYWSINLGAFLFPLILVPILRGIGWHWIIIASALGTGIMIIPTIFIYKEPPRPEQEKGKEFNLIKTVANAFEIIYSPFVLIYHYLRSSKSRALIIYGIIAILIILSLWKYLERKPVTETINEATIVKNGVALVLNIERDVMKENPYFIKTKYVLSKDGYNLNFELKPDKEAESLLKHIQQDNKDLSISILKPDAHPDLLYDHLTAQVKEYTTISKADFDSIMHRFDSKKVNRIYVTIAKPDQYEEFKSALLGELRTFQSLSNLSEESINKLLKRAYEKSLLTIKLDKQIDTVKPFSIQKDALDNVTLIIHRVEQYDSYKGELLNLLRENPNLISLTPSKLDVLIENSKQRSFFGLYLVLLFISSLIILKIQKYYVQSDKVKQIIYNLLSFAAILLIIWLVPGLDLFSRIVSSIIYFTVLSLYTIEIDDKSRFRDNFRFLLMIFIYSGFWILYFQMFDSVLWYVKAYVDATSVNNFINSIIGTIGINWSFNVEAVTYINAGTIILLQLIVSNIVKNMRALPTMVAGIALGTLGMAILAISTNIWVFVSGIIIFSIGEMTAHPKFYSYVGLTAPKDRVAMYMGYIFLYGVIGSSIGAILGANMYVHFVDKLNQPRTLWLIFSGIGIATIIGLLLYNRFTSKKAEE